MVEPKGSERRCREPDVSPSLSKHHHHITSRLRPARPGFQTSGKAVGSLTRKGTVCEVHIYEDPAGERESIAFFTVKSPDWSTVINFGV